MKRNAIGRIVIYSIVIVLLVCILLAGLGAGTFMFQIGSSGEYIEGGSSAPAADVKDIHIEWAAGTITILHGETEEIVFTEEYNSDAADSMAYDLRGGTLTLRYRKPAGIQIGFVSIPEKHLIITVPMDWNCGNLRIESASTDVEIQDLTIDKLDMDCASSDCILTNCDVRELNLNGASCDLDYTGTLKALDCDGASTSITAVFSNVPDSINLDGASAKLDITLPEDCGFQVEMDGMSNDFSSDFSTTSSGGSYTYGDGQRHIDVDGMSTTVRIRKGT